MYILYEVTGGADSSGGLSNGSLTVVTVDTVALI